MVFTKREEICQLWIYWACEIVSGLLNTIFSVCGIAEEFVLVFALWPWYLPLPHVLLIMDQPNLYLQSNETEKMC